MWQHLGVLLTLCGLGAAISDMTHICDEIRLGDVVPNPYDCQSYFVCAGVPTVSYCDAGLHFDAQRKVCNWPDRANCQLSVIDAADTPTTEKIAPTTAEPLTSSTAAANTDSSTNTTPTFNEWESGSKPSPTFMAVDVATGQTVDPMAQYDPQHIACRHYGAYFMPHPRSCSKYFLCAYGYLHQHQCGRGAHWNYKQQQCELSVLAECYSAAAAQDANSAPQKPLQSSIVCYAPYQSAEGSTLWLPMDNGNSNGPATSDTTMTSTSAAGDNPTSDTTATSTIAGGGNPTSDTTATSTSAGGGNPTTYPWYPTGSGHTYTETPPTAAMPDTTAKTTAAVVVALSSEAPPPRPPTTARTDAAILECPSNRQAYLTHPQECSKYYICIVGMPVLTSCPEGYFWDQKAEFCDLSRNVQCNQTQ